jgi:hypothetical protein
MLLYILGIFTCRGVLSSINSLFDPLGLTVPVTIAGKSLLREAMTGNHYWDAPLPSDYETIWEKWKTSLKELENLVIPRMYSNMPTVSPRGSNRLLIEDNTPRQVKGLSSIVTLNVNSSECKFQHTPKLR